MLAVTLLHQLEKDVDCSGFRFKYPNSSIKRTSKRASRLSNCREDRSAGHRVRISPFGTGYGNPNPRSGSPVRWLNLRPGFEGWLDQADFGKHLAHTHAHLCVLIAG